MADPIPDMGPEYSLVPVDHDPFATPKPGMTVPPLTSGALQAYPGQLTSAAWRMSGLGDVSDALSRGASWPEVVGAAVPAAMGAIQPEARGVGAAEEALAPALERGITAYHGSPHDFDRFDLSKIGTGEGAQAYGHGLYFAQNPDVAGEYKKSLSGNAVYLNGQYLGRDGDLPTATAEAAYKLASGQSVDDIRKATAYRGEVTSNRIASAAQRLLDQGADVKLQPTGKTYQVSINADPEQFLDWDKPLSQQTDAIKGALLNHPDPAVAAIASKYGDQVPTMYNYLAQRSMPPDVKFPGDYRDEAGASSILRQAGIPGIKYLDQGSRFQPQQVTHLQTQISGLEDALAKDPGNADVSRALQGRRDELAALKPTSNYVVFDDKLIDIVKKYGIAGLIGGGAAHFSTVPVDHDPFSQGAIQ